MKKSIDFYCRNTIKRSISPSLSLDNIDNTDIENQNDFEFFNKKFDEPLLELFETLDDIISYYNYELKNKLLNYNELKRLNATTFEDVKYKLNF